ncbi:hypothetical protein GK047_12855 [Paenibacillus sp. SYP-B3998]|uniref:Uncharacterized protein n=1 Tax=Paenibacillus sp. SYP-B3998 TaxID=2678564 RepID=A0A6G3ZXM5_9BACL|nr:hypothetical protein [Paenibacillus sp. SYP-B3998]NEW06892.1 hypothetical protein [Paenibacillus sp. SYP-B3998]
MLKRLLAIASFCIAMSFLNVFQWGALPRPNTANAEESNIVQVVVDKVAYKLNVADIPRFKEYLQTLPPDLQQLEKKRIRAWKVPNASQDILIVGTACGVKSCRLSVHMKRPGTDKWEGAPLEESAIYQESAVSPDQRKVAVVTSQSAGYKKTVNSVYTFKLDPAAAKVFTKLNKVEPKKMFNGSYSEPFHRFRFKDNGTYTADLLVQQSVTPPPSHLHHERRRQITGTIGEE